MYVYQHIWIVNVFLFIYLFVGICLFYSSLSILFVSYLFAVLHSLLTAYKWWNVDPYTWLTHGIRNRDMIISQSYLTWWHHDNVQLWSDAVIFFPMEIVCLQISFVDDNSSVFCQNIPMANYWIIKCQQMMKVICIRIVLSIEISLRNCFEFIQFSSAWSSLWRDLGECYKRWIPFNIDILMVVKWKKHTHTQTKTQLLHCRK